MPDIKSVHHVSVTVTDLDRSVAWYERVFGFTKVKEDKHPDGTGYFVLLGSADFAVLVALHVHPSNDSGAGTAPHPSGAVSLRLSVKVTFQLAVGATPSDLAPIICATWSSP